MMDDVVAFFAQHLRRVMKYLYSTHRVVSRRTNSASLRDHLITTVIIDLEGG
jgi:hypothetical protein